jgi:hypothetical protein
MAGKTSPSSKKTLAEQRAVSGNWAQVDTSGLLLRRWTSRLSVF